MKTDINIKTMNISAMTTSLELKASAILAQLGKEFVPTAINKVDMTTHGILHVMGFINGEYVSFHVMEDKITVLQERGDGANPHFKDFAPIREAVEYISTIGTPWEKVGFWDFKVDGTNFGMRFRNLIGDKYVQIVDNCLETSTGELIPVFPADEDYAVAVFVYGEWWAPSHNIYYYTDENGEDHQCNIC